MEVGKKEMTWKRKGWRGRDRRQNQVKVEKAGGTRHTELEAGTKRKDVYLTIDQLGRVTDGRPRVSGAPIRKLCACGKCTACH